MFELCFLLLLYSSVKSRNIDFSHLIHTYPFSSSMALILYMQFHFILYKFFFLYYVRDLSIHTLKNRPFSWYLGLMTVTCQIIQVIFRPKRMTRTMSSSRQAWENDCDGACASLNRNALSFS